MLLSTNKLLEYASCVFPVENRALLEIINRQWNNKQSDETKNFIICCRPFQDLNSIIVNMLLHLTRYQATNMINVLMSCNCLLVVAAFLET